MDRRRYAKRTIAVILGVVMALGAGSAVYAIEYGTYHDFRDNEVSVYLPDSWTTEEMIGEETGGYEQIILAQDENGDSGLNLEIYYMAEDAQDDYIYFDDDEEEALRYYEEYGEAAVDGLYDAVLAWPLENAAQSEWSISEPEYFNGQWNGFLVAEGNGSTTQVPGEGTTFNHTIYLTARMTDDSKTVVHMLLAFYNDDDMVLTEQQAKLAKEIADEFYDYDYYNVMTGASSDWGDDYDTDSEDGVGDLIVGVITILATLIGFISAIIVFVRKRMNNRGRHKGEDKGARSFSAGFTGHQQSFDLEETVSRFKKRHAEKKSFSGREQRMERRAEHADRREERRVERRSTMQMRNREAESAEQRYYASLQTLHKTGLLTKEEMRDMLERHERSRARQRNRS